MARAALRVLVAAQDQMKVERTANVNALIAQQDPTRDPRCLKRYLYRTLNTLHVLSTTPL